MENSYFQKKKTETSFQETHSTFAEVLFSFQPVGSQELALDKGALVEVIRREPGPWWWGQLRHDAVLTGMTVTDDFEVQEGWFPKDFVKVCSKNKRFC